MTLDWVACALIMALASLVMGLAGFGNALVAMAFLPHGETLTPALRARGERLAKALK